MCDYENIKVEINKEQPLEDIVNVLESKGYGVVNHYLRNHNFIVATVNYYGALNFDYWSENIELVTLAEIKEMEMTKSFDDAVTHHKNNLIENLSQFHEGYRVRGLLMDVESNKSDYEYYFNTGKQSLQAEIDELQKRIDDALEKCYTGIRKQGGDYYLELVEGILKGDTK